MRVAVCLFFLAFCAVVFAIPQEKDKYTTKYDNVDLDAIVKNDRLLRGYVDCLLGSKPCTKDGEELKKVVPDALQTECSKCNETQKRGVRKMMHHLIENKRDWYKELETVYDPKGEYKKRYEAVAKKEGLDI